MAAPTPSIPRIFVSHSHHDNNFCRPFVAHLRTALGLTDPDHIFYDESSLHTGDTWLRRLQQEVLARPIFIVILTPHSVVADYVQMETELALSETISHHERRICSVLVEPCDINQLAPALRRYQLVDMVQKGYDRAFADLLEGLRAPAGTRTGTVASAPRPANEPPTRTVDPLHRGDHATIAAALQAAKPGDRILIHPGLYREGLVLDKPLELVGDGAAGDVVIEATGIDVIRCATTMARVSNLTLRQLGGGQWYGVDIGRGRLELEGCDISSQSLACVAIHGGAYGLLRRNRIHDGKQGGVYVYDNGQGLLEDNDIFDNAVPGVEIRTRGSLTVRRNRIHDSQSSGVIVCETGQGLLEDNDIFANAYSGVEIKTGGSLAVRRNRITKNTQVAVYVYEGGGGVFEGNDLRDNIGGVWYITEDSKAKVTRKDNQE